MSVHTDLQISIPGMPAPGAQNADKVSKSAPLSSRGTLRGMSDMSVGIALNLAWLQIVTRTGIECDTTVASNRKKD